MKILKFLLAFAIVGIVRGTPNIIQVLESLELTKFLDGLKQCGLDRIINHEGHFTLFAPNNDAFDHEKWYPGEDGLCDKMSFHIGRGYFKKEDLSDEQEMKSLLSKRTVRINIYPFKDNVMTANGRVVIDFDHLARNGVVHIISEVMSSVYKRAGSVISEIDECCPEHSDLIELVHLSGLYDKLDKEGPFTLLAPNNGAFAKLHPDFIEHLKKNKTAMVNLLSGHVIPLTYYTAGLPENLDVKTLFGNTLHVTNTGGKVMFGKATVTLSDVTAGNGVVHAIDEVLFPKSNLHKLFEHRQKSFMEKPKKNLVKLCSELGFTAFAEALTMTGVDKVLNHEGSFTIFAPSNSAFKLPKFYSQSLSDRVLFHIGRGIVKKTTVRDEDQVMTLLSKRKIRFNIYQNIGESGNQESIITANGREVRFTGHEAHNGVIHEMVSSGMDYIYDINGTLGHEISIYPEFTAFHEIIQEFYGDILEHQPNFPMTVLVPGNSVIFDALTSMSRFEVAQRLLRNHFIPKTWYSVGLEVTETVTSLGGETLTVSSDNSGSLFINGILIEEMDFTTNNGAFHMIDGIL